VFILLAKIEKKRPRKKKDLDYELARTYHNVVMIHGLDGVEERELNGLVVLVVLECELESVGARVLLEQLHLQAETSERRPRRFHIHNAVAPERELTPATATIISTPRTIYTSIFDFIKSSTRQFLIENILGGGLGVVSLGLNDPRAEHFDHLVVRVQVLGLDLKETTDGLVLERVLQVGGARILVRGDRELGAVRRCVEIIHGRAHEFEGGRGCFCSR
jgi:hypothetical protein